MKLPLNRKEFIYSGTENHSLDELASIMVKNNYEFIKDADMEEWYFVNPADKNFINFNKVLKVMKLRNDCFHYEVVQKRQYLENSHQGFVMETIKDKTKILDFKNYKKYMKHLGFEHSLTLQWKIKGFEKNGEKIIIGRLDELDFPLIFSFSPIEQIEGINLKSVESELIFVLKSMLRQ